MSFIYNANVSATFPAITNPQIDVTSRLRVGVPIQQWWFVASTDPSNDFFINLNNNDHISKIYIRADDNINFPGKLLIQKYMKIIYTPYTDNISSTMIRNNIFNS